MPELTTKYLLSFLIALVLVISLKNTLQIVIKQTYSNPGRTDKKRAVIEWVRLIAIAVAIRLFFPTMTYWATAILLALIVVLLTAIDLFMVKYVRAGRQAESIWKGVHMSKEENYVHQYFFKQQIFSHKMLTSLRGWVAILAIILTALYLSELIVAFIYRQ